MSLSKLFSLLKKGTQRIYFSISCFCLWCFIRGCSTALLSTFSISALFSAKWRKQISLSWPAVFQIKSPPFLLVLNKWVIVETNITTCESFPLSPIMDLESGVFQSHVKVTSFFSIIINLCCRRRIMYIYFFWVCFRKNHGRQY